MNTVEFKKLREKLGYTQEGFAKFLGVHVRTIQNWEAGGKIPESKAALLRNMEIEVKTTLQDVDLSETEKIIQKNKNGDNFNGEGFSVNKADQEILSLLKKKDEQIDRLITIIENMQSNK